MDTGKGVLRDPNGTNHVTQHVEENVAEGKWSWRVRSWLQLGVLRVCSRSVNGEATSVVSKDSYSTIYC